jgi:hypothetical protein
MLPAVTDHGVSASPVERAIAGFIGCVAAAAGALAVFRTDNELGSGALLLAAAAFLVMATFGLVPVRFKVGDKEMEVGRAALHTLDKVLREADPATQETAIDAFEDELAARGITRESDDAVEAMLRRFERYSGSTNPRTVHDSLKASGWLPFTPAKSTYIRWVYNGKSRTVSLFQNSGALVAASVHLRDFAKDLPGATAGPKQEMVFAYAGDPATAIDAADAIRRFAGIQN